MFYLGEYDEDTAKEIKRHLDKAGLKVEVKSCLVIDEETTYYIKDKMSAISELTEDDTRQQDDLNSLDELRTLAIDVDYLDPGNGPDGDIEHHTEITLPS